MAAKLNAGEVGRGDLFFIDPLEITVGNNSRWQQFNESHVLKLLASFEKEGQLQPVQVRKIHDNKVQLVLGFHRHEASRRFNELHPDKKMKLQCRLIDCNEEEAFAKSIAENNVRSRTSPMDDAHAQRVLREQWGWEESRIAEYCDCTTSYVSLLKKLLALDKKTQLLVHEGQLAVNAACSLSDLPSSEQKEILQTSIAEVETAKQEKEAAQSQQEEPTTNIPATVGEPETPITTKPKRVPSLSKRVTKNVRDTKISHGQKQRRTVSEIYDFFCEYESTNPSVISVSGLMVQYISGSITDKTMRESLEQIL
jgi:ParB/RepB/Spo0J family partition protein